MRILCLGLSHHTAPVALRERLTYSAPALQAALSRFGCGQAERPAGVSELVILSTCSRLELYAATSAGAMADDAVAAGAVPAVDALPAEPEALDAWFEPMLAFVAETRGLDLAGLRHRFYRLAGPDASEHLGRVAAGLDSIILGEPQILGQVADAYALANAQGAAGPVLSALFQAAIRAGKRARTETGISRNPASLSSVAVKLAERVVGPLSERRVLVVGAGEMAELAVEALRARGANQLTVVNRTQARAAALAQRWGAGALTFEQLTEAVAGADLVITSTDAPHFIITAEVARAALAGRPAQPLLFIDLAVPRDVDPAVRDLPNAHCYDIDALEHALNGSLAQRQQEVPRVAAIVAGEMQAFAEWLRRLEVAPVIADLRAKAEAIRRAELDKTLRRLAHLGPEERQHIETLSVALINKLLHDLTLRLKAGAGTSQAAHYAAALRELFVLPGQPSGQS
jgi:glutamyl-tRNA reductase